MKRAVALTIALLAITAFPDNVDAVTYGDPVESPQVEFPEVVPIWVGGKALCTGTLIRQQVVLTAAHCVYGEPGPFQISVGAKNLNSGSLIDVDATWYHPRYDASFSQNDIALLHLKTSANVSRLGVLPPAKLKTLGKKFLIVGWGGDQNGLVTGKLNRLTLNDQTIAAKKDFKGYYNSKTMVGAGRYFADEVLYGGGCTGDSGGPLYQGAVGASRTIIGITSFGARGCVDYKPTIFTRVDFYVPEINKGIELLDSRSVSAPIPTGKATPVGVGPTTTTSTLPLAPLKISFANNGCINGFGLFSINCNNFEGISGMLKTNLDKIGIAKVCFEVDGVPMPDYGTTSTPGFGQGSFSYVEQSGGVGCYDYFMRIDGNKLYLEFQLLRLPPGRHSLVITVTDKSGRSAQSTKLEFCGWEC